MNFTEELMKKAAEDRLACLLGVKKKLGKDAAFGDELMASQAHSQAVMRLIDAINDVIVLDAQYVGTGD